MRNELVPQRSIGVIGLFSDFGCSSVISFSENQLSSIRPKGDIHQVTTMPRRGPPNRMLAARAKSWSSRTCDL